MKIRNKLIAVLLVCVMLLSSALITTVGAVDDGMLKIKFVPQSTAKAGETVIVDVYFTGENIKSIMLSLEYDEDILEILAGDEDNSYWEADTRKLNNQMAMSAMIDKKSGNILPVVAFNNPVTLNNNKLLQLEFSVSSNFAPGQSVSVSAGEVAFAVKDPADANADEVTFNSTDTPSLVLVEQGIIDNYLAADLDGYVINDKITVFELSALCVDTDGNEPIVTVNKGSEAYSFLTRNHLTKELTIKVGNVDYFLRDADANKILLDDVNSTDIALVYNDVNGTLRCYVNGNIAYYYTSAETPIMINDIVIDSSEFIAASGEESVAYGKGVTLNNAYNIGDSGTAEIIAYQEHNDENAIRILAGVDMPWYMSVGFELEVYKDGVGKGVEICSSQTIFESILSTSSETRIDIKATEYGYNYFAAMVIKGVDVSDGADYYIQITPFTAVGETKYHGTTAKINIDSQGNYSFE